MFEKEAEVFATYYESLFPNEFETFYKAFLKVAEPREKQIQIDAEHIRALQKQNGELTDKVKELEDKLANADYQLEGRDIKIKELEEQLSWSKQNYLDAERYEQSMEKRIIELEQQIEKMQNCRNCKNEKIEGACGHFTQVGWCKNWELAD